MTFSTLSIYCIAIGGTGMAPLACLLQELGHSVQGCDGPLYPPMSTLLEEAGIRPLVGFDGAHLGPGGEAGMPDLVIVGNAVPRSNPEAQRAEELGLERISMPQAISRFLLAGRDPLVVAGTHGKTTTTSMAAWIYERAGRDPGYLIGGLPKNLPASFRLGAGRRFVIEGDEYNAAYFDRGPKFLHYRPEAVLLTSVEYDHADLYPSPTALTAAYRQLVELIPDDGLLVAWGDDPNVRQVAAAASCPVVFYGFGEDNEVHPVGGTAGVERGPAGSAFRLEQGLPGNGAQGVERAEKGTPQAVELHVPGDHNLLNALAAWTIARRDGIPAPAVAEALGAFRGTRRRLEELGTVSGVTVVDDFAHHPTAVEASLSGLRDRFPGRPLKALFEPRSLTACSRLFQQRYVDAFSLADAVYLAPVYHAERLGPEGALDASALAAALKEQGVEVALPGSTDALVHQALEEARAGDVLVTMSSGSFEGAPRRLLAGLEERRRQC